MASGYGVGSNVSIPDGSVKTDPKYYAPGEPVIIYGDGSTSELKEPMSDIVQAVALLCTTAIILMAMYLMWG